MTCPTCKTETESVKTVIRRGKLVTGCSICLHFAPIRNQNDVAKYDRDRQREDYRQDITQPFEGRSYLKTRGIDKAREMGYSDEDIRQLY